MATEKAITLREPQALANLGEVQVFADTCFKSGLFPDCKSPIEAVMKIVAGRELGIPALMSLQKLYIVNGRMGLAGEVAVVLLQRAHYEISHKYDNRDNPTACEVTLTHPQKGAFTWRFTMADAKRAGLVKPNSAWEKFPQDLLYYRALMSAARKFAPEALGGIGYTPEELQSIIIEPVESSVKPASLVDTAKELGAIELPKIPLLNKKYGVSLEFCWHKEHDNDAWQSGQFGSYHKAGKTADTPKGFCNFRDRLKPIAAEIAKSRDWDADAMNEVIKEKYDNRTWSKLREEEQCLFLESLINSEEAR